MKKVSVMVAAILGLALSVGANAQVSKKDQEFLNKAAVGGLYEVEAGRFTQKKANISDFKAFWPNFVQDPSSPNPLTKALSPNPHSPLPPPFSSQTQQP